MIPRGDVSAPSKPGYSFKIFFTFVLRCAKFRHWYFLLSALKKLSSNARSMEINFNPMGSCLFRVPHRNTTFSLPNEVPLVMDAVNLPKSMETELLNPLYPPDTDIAAFSEGKEQKSQSEKHTNSMWKSASITLITRGEPVFMFYFRFRCRL